MAPGLARRHPEIKTYSGRGITDPTASIHADLTPLGFRASVRSARGAWYIDPYYVGRDRGVYASYYARDAKNTNGAFVEHDSGSAGLSLDESRPSSNRRRAPDLPAGADHRPGVLHVPRRLAVRDRSQGRAREPSDADLRGRPHDPPAVDREQRSPQPRRLWHAVAPNGPCGSRGLLHPVPGHRMLEHTAAPAT